ncbi:MAG TPA: hypothetical protein PLX89_25890, partial [Verrucomicrobiota bacterium]|nr:hypothetical protein [Verrucomicrobiota bacterium]
NSSIALLRKAAPLRGAAATRRLYPVHEPDTRQLFGGHHSGSTSKQPQGRAPLALCRRIERQRYG